MRRKTAKPAAPQGQAATPLPDSMATGKASPAKTAVGDKPVLAYIASLLLRTVTAMDKQLNQPIQYEIDVPPRGRVGWSEDDKPATVPEPTYPETPQCPHTTARKPFPTICGASRPACRGRSAATGIRLRGPDNSR